MDQVDCLVEFWYNTLFHSATDMTPFKAVYERDPPPLFHWVEEGSKVEKVNQLIRERNIILDNLKANLTKARERMRGQDNKHRKEVVFNIGDQIFFKFQPYRFRSLHLTRTRS